MPEPVLTVLKFVFLALVYLFFFRVVRAVWVVDLSPATAKERQTTRSPKRAAAAPGPRSGPTAFELVGLDPEAIRGRTFVVDAESTVGRTAGCQVQLDDSTVSQLHARLFVQDGRLLVEDLGSTNGTFVNRRKVSSPTPMRRGDRVAFGHTQLEVRR